LKVEGRAQSVTSRSVGGKVPGRAQSVTSRSARHVGKRFTPRPVRRGQESGVRYQDATATTFPPATFRPPSNYEIDEKKMRRTLR